MKRLFTPDPMKSPNYSQLKFAIVNHPIYNPGFFTFVAATFLGLLLFTGCSEIISLTRNDENAETVPPAPRATKENEEAASPLDTTTEDETAGRTRTSFTPPPTLEPTPIPDTDLWSLNLGNLGSGSSLTIRVEEGDSSVLFYIRSDDPQEYIVIDEISDPQGQVLYQLDPATGRASGTVFNQRLENNGSIALYLPLAPQFDLEPGDYTIFFRTGDNDPVEEAGVLVRSGEVDVTQALDLNLWVVSPSLPLVDSEDLSVNQLRAEIDAILSPHDLAIGKINVITTSTQIKAQFSEIGPALLPAQLSDLCLAMSKQLGSQRALNVAVLDKPAAGTGQTVSDVANDELEGLAGFAGGPRGAAAGQPGTVLIPNSARSCAVILLDGNNDFSQNRQGQNILRQASLLMGVPFTTGPEGLIFDLFTDTAECLRADFDTNGDDVVDSNECAGADANNYMFWEEGGTVMSSDQAWTLRRHPLFYSIEEE